MAQQIEIKQGVRKEFVLDTTDYPQLNGGEVWKLALVSPSTNKRFVANTDTGNRSNEHTVVLFLPTGLINDETTGALVLNTDEKNGTAHMPVGVYNLEIYPSDRTDIATAYECIRVRSSNFMTSNTADGEEQPESESESPAEE